MRLNVRALATLTVLLGAAVVLPAACTSSTSNPGGINVDGGGLDVANPDAENTGDGSGAATEARTPTRHLPRPPRAAPARSAS